MQCPNCKHENHRGNFCEKCGTRLATAEAAENPANPANESQISLQLNKQLKTAKHVSKMYFGFFTTVIKQPYAILKNVGQEQFVNGLITIFLYSLVIPLMIYFGLNDFRGYIGSPFSDIVLRPTIGFFLFILLIATYTYVAIKLGKLEIPYKAVIGRFGTALIPFVGILLLAFLFSIIKIHSLSAFLLLIGLVASIFIVPATVLISYKHHADGGLDAVYGIVLTYIASILSLAVIASIFLSIIEQMISSYFSSLFF